MDVVDRKFQVVPGLSDDQKMKNREEFKRLWKDKNQSTKLEMM